MVSVTARLCRADCRLERGVYQPLTVIDRVGSPKPEPRATLASCVESAPDVRYLRRMSIVVETARLFHEASEILNDSRYSIRTAGYVLQTDTGVANADANEYAATPYRVIRRLFRLLPPQCFDGSFIDYGAGRGRVTIVASRYPFRRVIGVELSELLHREAQENLRSTPVRRTCEVQLLRTDAAHFEIPDDVTVAYFYKPFGRSTTEQVLRRIKDSLRRQPREVWILAYNAALLVDVTCSHLNAELVRARSTVYPSIPWAAMRVRGGGR
jgi:hypothetical protein